MYNLMDFIILTYWLSILLYYIKLEYYIFQLLSIILDIPTRLSIRIKHFSGYINDFYPLSIPQINFYRFDNLLARSIWKIINNWLNYQRTWLASTLSSFLIILSFLCILWVIYMFFLYFCARFIISLIILFWYLWKYIH